MKHHAGSRSTDLHQPSNRLGLTCWPEAKHGRESWQAGGMQRNESLNFGLRQEPTTLHACRLRAISNGHTLSKMTDPVHVVCSYR